MSTCRFDSSNAAVCACLIDVLEKTRSGSTESLKCQVCSEVKTLMCASESCSHPVCMDCMNRILQSERDVKCPTCRCAWTKIKTFIPISHSLLSLVGSFEGNECPLCNTNVVSSSETVTSFTAEQFQTHVLSSCSSITCPCGCESGKHNNMSGFSACFREFVRKFSERVESVAPTQPVAPTLEPEESISDFVENFNRNSRFSQHQFRAGIFFVLQMIILVFLVIVVFNVFRNIISNFVFRWRVENYDRPINY